MVEFRLIKGGKKDFSNYRALIPYEDANIKFEQITLATYHEMCQYFRERMVVRPEGAIGGGCHPEEIEVLGEIDYESEEWISWLRETMSGLLEVAGNNIIRQT